MDNVFYYECWSGVHEGGTKFYSIHQITGPNGFFTIWQFGKVGTFGTLNFHRGAQNSQEFRANEMKAKVSQRMNNGYAMSKKIALGFKEITDLYSIAGRPLVQKILADETDWLKEIDAALERSRFVAKSVSEKIDREAQAKLLKEMQAQSELREQRARDAEVEEMKKNPLFGMF